MIGRKKKIKNGVYCAICGRLLTTETSKERGIGPICIGKVMARWASKFDDLTLEEWLLQNKVCSQCEDFTASKRGNKKKEEYKLFVIERNKKAKLNKYYPKEAIVGFCNFFRLFVDGNIVTECGKYKKRKRIGGKR